MCHPFGASGGTSHGELSGVTVQTYYSLQDGPACVVPDTHATWAEIESPNGNAGILGQIAVAKNAGGYLQAFAVGSDQHLWTTHQEAAPALTLAGVVQPVRWSSWTTLAGSVTFNSNAAPAVFASPNDGHLELYAYDAASAILRFFQNSPNSATWSSETVLSAGSPIFTATAGAGGEPVVVAANGPGNATALWRTSAGWQRVALATPSASVVAAALDSANALETFVADGGGNLAGYSEIFPNPPTEASVNVGAPSLISALQVARNSDGTLELFALSDQDAANSVIHYVKQVAGGTSWGAWQELIVPQAGPLQNELAVASSSAGPLDLFFAGTTLGVGAAETSSVAERWFRLYHAYQLGSSGSGGWNAGPLGGNVTSAPGSIAVAANGTGALEAFTVQQSDFGTANSEMWHIWQASPGGGWSCYGQGGLRTCNDTVSLLSSPIAENAVGTTSSYMPSNNATTPAVFVRPSTEVDIVARAPDGSLQYYSAMPGALFNQCVIAPAGSVFSSPSMTVRSSGEVDVAAAGPSGSLVYYAATPPSSTQCAGTWLSCTVGAPGTTFSAPSVAVRSTGEVDIAAMGPNASLNYSWNTVSGISCSHWSTAQVAAAGEAYTAPSMVVSASGEADIAVGGPLGTLAVYSAVPGGAWSFCPVAGCSGNRGGAGATFSAPSLAVRSSGEVDMVTQLGDGSQSLMYYSDSQPPIANCAWSCANIPSAAGATTPALTATTPALSVGANGTAAVAALGATGTLSYFLLSSQGAWSECPILERTDELLGAFGGAQTERRSRRPDARLQRSADV